MKRLFLLLLFLPCAFALDVPQPTGFVNDYGELFTPDERGDLEALLQRIEQQGTIEIAVLTLPSLEDENLEQYTTRVFRAWGVGKKDVNNGVLLLISRDDRQVRIEVGTGMEGVITDITAGMLIRKKMAPAFKGEKYAAGVALVVQDIWKLAEGDIGTRSQYTMVQGGTNSVFEFIIVLLIIGSYLAVLGCTALFYKEKHQRKKIQTKTWYLAVIAAWVLSVLLGSSILWLALFFLLMFGTVGGGIMFFPMFGRGGMGGGFGGFGGGFSGGGGASGGW